MTAEVIDLFPIPLIVEQLSIDPKEREYVLKLAEDANEFVLNGAGNLSSKNSYILDNMPKLYERINYSLNMYVEKVSFSENPLVITQSWINCNPPGTSHHKHSHTNSILSGVIYLQTDNKTGDINFYRPGVHDATISHMVSKFEKYNCEFFHFQPKNNQLFLFPSNLVHSVNPNNSIQDRISLSFNTFYADSFGSELNRTRVDISRARKKA